ncbi:phospholipase D-like domain-containing protein [Acidimicrobium ferrooxidans]|uniref:phospholipase D-like domain-containing protein n=1 Tax=Acidimicrobium ferrooxidans TaxID=53635 RepID=UPI00019DDEA4|nr:phospholipase D-like domain-containing protein [Acidimicrobium ferrooxidans]
MRTLTHPYVHAKLIVTADATFVGSQNFSVVSMNDNREVGVITANPTVHALALAWFDDLWSHASVVAPTSTPAARSAPSQSAPPPPAATTPAPSTPAATSQAPAPTSDGGDAPWIPYGATESQVEALWGAPGSITTTVDDGEPEVVWNYAAGSVDFENGTVVDVDRAPDDD